MAYSQDIIQIVADNVAAIPTTAVILTVPAFYTKEVWDFNQLTGLTYPLVLLERPIKESVTASGNGRPVKKYDLIMWILGGTVQVNSDHATYKEPLMIIAEAIKLKLIKLLSDYRSAAGNIEDIKSYSSLELPESKLDDGPVGLILTLQLTYQSKSSIDCP